jgi:hypothetical protein
VGRALYQETEVEATECKKLCPVDTGALRASIFVVGPIVEGKKTKTMIVCGGPAAPYAFWVHENLVAIHPVGQAKFIEAPLLESRTSIAGRVAARVDLNRAMKGQP